MALRYLIYRTDVGNTIVRETPTNTATGGTEQALYSNFYIPINQPIYLWRVSGISVIPNTNANVNQWTAHIAPPPTSNDNVTYDTFTGVTNTKLDKSTFSTYTGTTVPNTYETKAAINTFTGTTLPANYYNKTQIQTLTGATGLQQVTQVGATTNIESTFNGGLKLAKIRPTGNTTTAIQIRRADGITPVVNIDTVSGLTGFNQIAPQGVVHAYGNNPFIDSGNTMKNAVIIDGGSNVDKDIQWAENGRAKWLAETYRGENSNFWYLYSVEAVNSPLTIKESGRIGINKTTNQMDYHSAQIVGSGTGLSDMIVSGTFTQSLNIVYEVMISANGTPDQFRWRKSIDDGVTYGAFSSPSGITTTPLELEFGVNIQFGSLTGHTISNMWQFAAFTQIPQGTLTVAPMGFAEILVTNDYTQPIPQYLDITTLGNGSIEGGSFAFKTGTGSTLQSLVWGSTVDISSVFFNFLTGGTSLTLVVEFWNGSAWVALSPVSNFLFDNTFNGSQSGLISWETNTFPTWIKSLIPGDDDELFWMRLRTTTNAVIAPVGKSMSVGNNKRFAVYGSFSSVRPDMYIDSIGRVNIGGGNMTGSNKLQVNCANNVTVTTSGTDSLVEFDSQNSSVVDLKIKLASNDACAPGLTFVSTRGTLDQTSCTQTGDMLGRIDFRGRAGTFGRLLAQIQSQFVGSATTRCGDILFSTANGLNPIERVRISHDGMTGFGIGSANATALVHIGSGTTLNAPLRLTSGNLLSSPQSGAIEYKSNAYYGTTTGNTRHTFAFLDSPVFTGAPQFPSGTTFADGLATCGIRPLVDGISALHIHKADGVTAIVNFDTISGFTGFKTCSPKTILHTFGSDVTPADGWNYQTNALRLDGIIGVDKDIQWADNGIPQFTAQIYRGEGGNFWYLSSPQDHINQITVSKSGRFGINNQTNIMNYHAIVEVGGPNDLTIGGYFNQNYTIVYEIEIDSVSGLTDTFRWRKSLDQGQTFGTFSATSGLTLTPIEIEFGVTVQWDSLTGHTLGTTWIFGAFAQLPIGTSIVAPNRFNEVQTTNDYTAPTIIYNDVTAEANSSTLGSTIKIFNTGVTDNAIYFGTLGKLNSVFANLSVNGQGVSLVTEYWNGVSWINMTLTNNAYRDGTFNLTESGNISWETSSMVGWQPAYMPDLVQDGYQLYWIRLRTSTNPTIAPIANSFARGGNYRFAVLTSPSDFKPAMYVDSLGRTNIGGGNMTGCNVFQINPYINNKVLGGRQNLFEIDSQNACVGDIKIKIASNDCCATGIVFAKTRGTLINPLDVQNGDLLGHVEFRASINSSGALVSTIESQYMGNGITNHGDILFSAANAGIVTEIVRMSGSGTTGFGITHPVAVAHLKAGTTTIAPLRFTSGSLLTTPQSGAVEYKGNAFYGTTTGGTRHTFAFLDSPQFTGNPNLPVGTTLNSQSLCNYILYSGGSNNTQMVFKTQFDIYTGTTAPAIYETKSAINTFTGATLPAGYVGKVAINTYTGTTAPNQFASKAAINTYTGTTAPNTYETKSAINTFTGTTLPANYPSKTTLSTYTGTTAPATYVGKIAMNTYSGTTAPNIFASKTAINTYTGTTAPNTYVCKTNFNTYTGNTAPILNSAVTGATNGLTKTSRNLGLGGNLTQNTVITGGTFDFTLSSKSLNLCGVNGINICENSNKDIILSTNGGNISLIGNTTGGTEKIELQISNVQATITDSRAVPRGIEYNADYSSTYTDRSLVDKAYVNSIATGISVKQAVEAATTGNTTLSGLTKIDGVQTTTGMRILVKDQISGQNNGIYSASTSTWGRVADFDGTPAGEVSSGAYMAVISGATNKNTSWILQTPNPITVGVTPLTFVLFSTVQGTVAGNGICVTVAGGNNVISIKLPASCGLCSDSTGLYINPNIGGVGICYGSGTLCFNGTGVAGNSLSWDGTHLNVNTTGGTLSTALASKTNVTTFNLYTGTTAPATYALKSSIATYTGTTAPATYVCKTNFNTFTGTTLPAGYVGKAAINTYTGTTAPNIYETKVAINTYTGTTAPTTFVGKTAFNTYSGTTVPATYETKSAINTYTGTTAPNTYVCKTNFNTYTGATQTTLGTFALKSAINTYTGTTAPATYETKAAIATLTGTTLPATYAKLSSIATYTGTTAPATYVCKTNFNTYTGATHTCMDRHAYLSGATFTGTVKGNTPAVNDNSTCFITSAWYLGQCASVTPLMDGTGAVGTSTCWAHSDHVHPSDTSRAATTTFNTYTGTTAPATYVCKTNFNTFTGTTLPANYVKLTSIATYTGTTAPATYVCKTNFNTYTGATHTCMDRHAYLSGATFTGVVNVCKPAQNDNTNCAATTSWYISQGSTALPLVDGAAACGTSNLFARQDHIHPTDTSRAATSTFNTYTGTTAPAQFVGKTAMNTYSGTTVPATYVAKTAINTYTGTTAPATFAGKTAINTYTGTTAPATYVSKTNFNTYTGATRTELNLTITGTTNLGTANTIGAKSARNITLKSISGTCGITISNTANVITICKSTVGADKQIIFNCGTNLSGSTKMIYCYACDAVQFGNGSSSTGSLSASFAGGEAIGIRSFAQGSTNNACAPQSVVLGGSGNTICSGALRSAIIGSCGITLTGATYNDTAAVRCFAIFGTPATADLSLSTDQTLFWNSASKKIEAVKLTGGSDNYGYCECITCCSTTNTTCLKYLGFCPTTISAGRYSIDFSAQFGNASANACTFAAFKLDGTTWGCNYLGRDNQAGWLMAANMSRDVTLTTATHCMEVFFWNAGGTACMPMASVRIKRIC